MGFSSGTFTYTGSSTTFSAPVTGTTISSTAAAAAFTETATGLSTCLLKDGTQTATAAIPLAVAGSALTHAARINELQNGYGTFLTSVAGSNTITATATPTPVYTVGQRFTFVPAAINTGAATLNISSLGAGAVQLNGAALTGGELVSTMPVTVYVSAATPVFEIVQGNRVGAKVITLTRDVTAASGSVAYTGVGFSPKHVIFLFGNAGASDDRASIGYDDGTTAYALYGNAGGTGGAFSIDANDSLVANTAEGVTSTVGHITTVGSDGFTITWTKAGSPAAGTLTAVAICFR